MSTIQFFIKFGQTEHLELLLKKGRIYINYANYFKRESSHGRFDITEGRQTIIHSKDAVLEVKVPEEKEWKKLKVKTGIFENYINIDRVFIYCLFCILASETKEMPRFELTNEIKEMGESYLLIKNSREFMRRVVLGLNQNNYNHEYSIINYYNPESDHKKLGLFYKQEKYNYQKEFRILVESEPAEHIQFDIGSLEDIAEICPTNKFKGFDFVWED
jgi:hypothetical protein